MKVLYNTTKTMTTETPAPAGVRGTRPRRLAEAEQLAALLKGYDRPRLARLMDLSPKLAAATARDLALWGEPGRPRRPALGVFVGLVFQHLFALGNGFFGVGANGFLYEQITDDTGAGALLGPFRGQAAGVGPVLSYIHPVGATTLVLEARWLPELSAKRRLKGDYLWLKGALDF